MKIIKEKIIDKYRKKSKNKDLNESLKIWLEKTIKANWKCPNDIRKDFTTVSILPCNRVVFNVVGNQFRLTVIVVYANNTILIEWIGNHQEYDRLDLTKKILKFR